MLAGTRCLSTVSLLVLLLPGLAEKASASQISIPVSVDGTAEATDGVNFALRPSSDDVLYGLVVRDTGGFSPVDRAVLEFSLSGFAVGDTVNSVSFAFRTGSTGTDLADVNIYGYPGDGTLTASDATVAATLLGSYNPSVLGLGDHTVSLDHTYLQSLIGSSSFLGLRLQASAPFVNTSLSSMEQAALIEDPGAAAHLVVSFTPVPEPTSLLLFATGLGALCAAGRQRKK